MHKILLKAIWSRLANNYRITLLSIILFVSCNGNNSNINYLTLKDNYSKLAFKKHNSTYFMQKCYTSNYVVVEYLKQDETSLFGIINYGTFDSYNFGNHFKSNKNGIIYKYSFTINNKCNNYELFSENCIWNFKGNPIVAKVITQPNNKVEILISTYLIKIKSLKYSYNGLDYNPLALREAEFMPFLNIAELNDCFNKKIYLKLEIKKTEVEIKDYPKVFYDTLYFE